MAVPALLRERLGNESVRARVPIGGNDEVLVTPTRTIVYRAEGLLSDESVEEHSHQAERITVEEGRRKSTLRLDHGLDGATEFAVPEDRVDDVLIPLVEGVFGTVGITAGDEAVRDLFRLGELTVVVTDGRVVKHVGTDIWDEEFDAYPYDAVTGLDIEAGTVSSQVIVEVDGRPQRIKTPTTMARGLRQAIEDALLDYHAVENFETLADEIALDDDGTSGDDVIEQPEPGDGIGGPSPAPIEGLDLSTDDESTEATTADDDPLDRDAIAEELAALRTAVEQQNDRLESHERTIEKLIEALQTNR